MVRIMVDIVHLLCFRKVIFLTSLAACYKLVLPTSQNETVISLVPIMLLILSSKSRIVDTRFYEY